MAPEALVEGGAPEGSLTASQVLSSADAQRTAQIDTALHLSADRPAAIPDPSILRRGASTAPERLKARAFELYADNTCTIGAIARQLNCSRQYLYRVAQAEDWATRRARLRAIAWEVGAEENLSSRSMELARAELQAKVHMRLLELEKRCERGDLRAIVAWLKLAGVDKPDGAPKRPPTVGVENDLTAQQQVTIGEEKGAEPNEPTD